MTSKIVSVLNLLRIRQYYKNIMIFVGVFFSEQLFETDLYLTLIIGFILLCCVSSFNYIINDIRDIENDKTHTEKLKKKPLATGELSISFAIVLLIALSLVLVLMLIFLIPNPSFILFIIIMFITGQLYNHLFKNYAFIDIIILSTGYLWRALAGCAIINEFVSAWLFLAIFELAMFLSIAKRKGDLEFLGEEKAVNHKKIYDQYSMTLINYFQIIITGSLFMTYSLYLIIHFNLAEPAKLHEYIVISTIPISLYLLMRYLYLTTAKPDIARNTERAFLDKGIIIAGVILLGILFISFYFDILF